MNKQVRQHSFEYDGYYSSACVADTRVSRVHRSHWWVLPIVRATLRRYCFTANATPLLRKRLAPLSAGTL